MEHYHRNPTLLQVSFAQSTFMAEFLYRHGSGGPFLFSHSSVGHQLDESVDRDLHHPGLDTVVIHDKI
jgi:hypothetical protein